MDTPTQQATTPASSVLAFTGEMGARILGFDWSKTPLGPIGSWSHSLRTTVALMLNSRFPMLLWWTGDYICIYNDAYIPVLGVKHPWGFGKPVRETWSEIWHVLQPLIDSPFNGGPSTWMDDICLIINRTGYTEETHFTIAYSPAPDTTAPSGTGGVMATVVEISEQVINERALETMRKLGSGLMGCQSEQEVLLKTAQTIGENNSDFPFAVIYSIDEAYKEAKLVAAAGIDHPSLDPPKPLWQAVETMEPVIIDHPGTWFDPLPIGSWEVPPHQAIAIPIVLPGHHVPAAVMIVALNPYRRLEGPFMRFIRLITDQIAQALANVTAIGAERKRMEAMAALDKAKTLFFSNISHEFRTPLTLMLGPLEELLQLTDVEWRVAKLPVETAYRNAVRLLKLVNTLLEFSRLESGRSDAWYTATDLGTYTRNLAGNFRPSIEKAGLRFDVRTTPMQQPVYIDEGMWEKIVFNLLSNAFKYTLKGNITVEVSAVEEAAVLTVSDTGVGIPAEELPYIFDRFHRVQNSQGRSFEGTGIGLSLIKELVQLHGGTIDVDSVEGEGSVFRVTIPFGKEHLPSEQVADTTGNKERVTLTDHISDLGSLLPVQETQTQIGPAGDSSHTILIVDDNADMRRHIGSVLGNRYAIMMASNGREALSVIRNIRPSLILSDLMMPVMDGAELLRELKQDPGTADIPVILITARAGEESMVDGFETGADDYLVKPFSGKELLARIKAQLRIVQLREQAIQEQDAFATKLEREVEARTYDLVTANKELESFSYVTSHDLQEPLRKIQMFIDRIVNERGSSEALMMKISEEATRMRRLIDSMLAYSRLAQAENERSEVDLSAVMADVCRDFEWIIEEKKAKIHIGAIPTIRANRFHLHQLFSNLLSNALKFSRNVPVIHMTADIVPASNVPTDERPVTGETFVRITFSDNGIGFEQQFNKKIFDLFQRLHGKHEFSGTGIGLSIVKKIVDQHGGYVAAQPGAGGGATFLIWLPATPTDG